MSVTATKITIVVVFRNNRREAQRTLYTLSSVYQKEVTEEDYNVIVVDDNSKYGLDEKTVKHFGPNFSYHDYKSEDYVPLEALIWGVLKVETPYVMCMSDGAYMITPKVVKETQRALRLFEDGFVYTCPFLLSPLVSKDSKVNAQYQAIEDELLRTTNWKRNGYELFAISNIENVNNAFLSPVPESYCFTLSKEKLISNKAIQKAFITEGKGMKNLALFKNFVESPELKPVGLVGEGSFYQTNHTTFIKSPPVNPIGIFEEEYKAVNGNVVERSGYRPYFWGQVSDIPFNQLSKKTYRDALLFARRMSNMNEAQDVIDRLEFIQQINEHHGGFYNTLGYAYYESGNLEEAQANYEKAVKASPELKEGHFRLAEILTEQGQTQGSIDILQNLLKENPEEPSVVCQLALNFHELEMPKESHHFREQAYELLKVKPEPLPKTYINLAGLYEKEGDVEQSLKIFEMGLEYHKNLSFFYLHIGRLLNNQGKSEEAEPYYLKAIEHHVGPAEYFYVGLANCYIKQGKNQAAIDLLENAKNVAKESQLIMSLLEKLRYTDAREVFYKEVNKEEIEAKLAELNQTLETSGGTPNTYTQLATFHAALENKSMATEYANKAQELITSTSDIRLQLYVNLSMVWEQLGEINQASEILHAGLDEHENNSVLYFYLGRLFNGQEAFLQAQTYFKKAIEFHTGNPQEFYMVLAKSYAKEGYISKGIKVLEEAQKYDPNNKNVNELLYELKH